MKNKKDKEIIELLNCPRGGHNCADQRDFMNENLVEAREYFFSKEYNHGFKVLKQAYESTFELQKDPCFKCARMFRDVIIESCEQTTTELKKMTSGLFKRTRYQSDYQKAKEILAELKKKNK